MFSRQNFRTSRITKAHPGRFLFALPFLLTALFFSCFDSVQASDRELSFEELDLPAILLPPGTCVPENLDNADLWCEWIEVVRGTPLPKDFRSVAHLFKEEGEKLGIFWPAVLVQSLHETNFFRYGGRARMENFNAGGVGITPDERTTTRQDFETLRNGVRAMLEHVAVYADPYRMEKVIRKQNETERGVGTFTARRTEQVLRYIRAKYDGFRTVWPDQPVRIIDLGSWAPEEKLKQMDGYAEHGPTQEIIHGASLAYAEDPFYGAKLYRWWHTGSSYVRSRHSESRTTVREDESPQSRESVTQAVLRFSLLFLPLRLSP